MPPLPHALTSLSHAPMPRFMNDSNVVVVYLSSAHLAVPRPALALPFPLLNRSHRVFPPPLLCLRAPCWHLRCPLKWKFLYLSFRSSSTVSNSYPSLTPFCLFVCFLHVFLYINIPVILEPSSYPAVYWSFRLPPQALCYFHQRNILSFSKSSAATTQSGQGKIRSCPWIPMQSRSFQRKKRYKG